ncbi:MAG: toll/interleukin-1 receptor domain-containing protein [Bryobacterales bacterium]|nr:toll/interleukin-1 receptor domain-containing protein [Bryobacterales bacterium]
MNTVRISFFISYTAHDVHWAEWIAWNLEQSGFQCVIQAWDFKAGKNFVQEMQKALSSAERVLAVVSPHYMESRYARDEWAAAYAKGNLVPVVVSPVALDGLDSAIVYIDLSKFQEEEAALQALLTGLALTRRKPPGPPSFPGLDRPPFPTLSPVTVSTSTERTSRSKWIALGGAVAVLTWLVSISFYVLGWPLRLKDVVAVAVVCLLGLCLVVLGVRQGISISTAWKGKTRL